MLDVPVHFASVVKDNKSQFINLLRIPAGRKIRFMKGLKLLHCLNKLLHLRSNKIEESLNAMN